MYRTTANKTGRINTAGKKSKIEIAQVVKNCASTGNPPGHQDLIFLNKGQINLSQCVLMLTHHDGRPIPVQKKHILLERF